MNSAGPKPTRERARIGADQARWWVRHIHLGNPYAKAILMAVANYMNENGAAWPGLSTLASDTDISEDTIASRLRWCEAIGAIVQLKVWVDENGRRNYEKRGRPTSSEIRFMFDADIAAIEDAAQSASGPRQLRGAALKAHVERGQGEAETGLSDSDDSQISPRPGRMLTDEALRPVSTRLAPEQPPPGAARSLELESLESPPTPPSGGAHAVDSQVSEATEPIVEVEGWKDFKAAFEGDGEPIVKVSLAKQLLAALTTDERAQCTKAARGLIVWRSRQKKPQAKPAAQTFIREIEGWEGWTKHAPPDPAPPQPRQLLAPGSAEFKAVLLCRVIARERLTVHVADGIEFIGTVPAGAAGLAGYVDGNSVSDINQATWQVVAKGTDRFVAWSERVREWLGLWAPTKRYWLDQNGNIVDKYEDAYVKPPATEEQRKQIPERLWTRASIEGLLVPETPTGFPPPKGDAPSSS